MEHYMAYDAIIKARIGSNVKKLYIRISKLVLIFCDLTVQISVSGNTMFKIPIFKRKKLNISVFLFFVYIMIEKIAHNFLTKHVPPRLCRLGLDLQLCIRFLLKFPVYTAEGTRKLRSFMFLP
jgi:hypothetical protein